LFSAAQLREVAEDLLPAVEPGSVVISHTTGPSTLLTALSAGAPHLTVVDAPFSGTAEDVAAGRLTVLLGGDRSAVDRARQVVGAYADRVIETGGLGTASDVKLINNVLFAANAQLVASAVDVGARLGITEETLLEVLEVFSGGSRLASYAHRFGGVRAFAAGTRDVLSKDVAAYRDATAPLGIEPDLLSRVVTDGPLVLTPGPVPPAST
jgi:3-hydroxyisobutyrate dehydrogenase-like beta-hydroxyacid dehydrogenase